MRSISLVVTFLIVLLFTAHEADSLSVVLTGDGKTGKRGISKASKTINRPQARGDDLNVKKYSRLYKVIHQACTV